MRKRSKSVAIALLGAAAFGLSACKEQETDARAFPDVQSCKAAARENDFFFSEADCDAAFTEALATHLETAPRYESLELCEAEHGAGACGRPRGRRTGRRGRSRCRPSARRSWA